MYPAIIEAAGVALIVTILFAILGTRGPWDSLWSLFLVLFLAMLATIIYSDPLGSSSSIIPWASLILPGILFGLLLLAVTPVAVAPVKERGHLKAGKISSTGKHFRRVSHFNPRIISSMAIGKFFWLVIMIFTLAVIVGLGV
jgi:hypothetical protein